MNNDIRLVCLAVLAGSHTLSFEEKQSEITGAWIDETLSLKQHPEVVPNIQYGPQKKRGKGKVKKW